MDEALRLSQRHTQGVVVTKIQTQGRGRFNRQWVSDSGNFYGTFFLKYDNPQGALSLNMAYHLFCTLQPFFETGLSIKWPNDLLFEEQKIAGILLEYHAPFLLIGIGVNLKTSPQNITQKTTSLFEAKNIEIDPIDFLKYLEKGLMEALQKPFAEIKDNYSKHMAFMNQSITVSNIEGILEGVNPDGSLVLRNDSGMHTIFTGDVLAF